MARGGRRSGRQGQGYSNRTDLNESVERAPAVQPAAASGTPSPGAAAASMDPTQMAYIRPDDLPTLTSETQRPNEPITAGLPIGPGASPDPMALTSAVDKTGITLRLLYEATGSDDIRRMIAAHESRGGM